MELKVQFCGKEYYISIADGVISVERNTTLVLKIVDRIEAVAANPSSKPSSK